MKNDTTPSRALSGAEAAAFFAGLRQLAKASGPNKHDIVENLIIACIEGGIDTRPAIIGALKKVDFNQGHIAIRLKERTGSDPTRHLWQLDQKGRYRLREDERDGEKSAGSPSPHL